MRSQTQTVTTTDAYADGAQRLRAALGADGAAVIRRKLPFGFEVLASDSVRAFNIRATISAALMDVVIQTSRTLTPVREDSVVLAPIVADGVVVAALHVVRRGARGFSPGEVLAAEMVAEELGRIGDDPDVTDPMRRPSLSPRTIMNLLDADSESIQWSDATAKALGTETVLAFGPWIGAGSNHGLRASLSSTLTKVLDATAGHIAAISIGSDPFRVLALAATQQAPDLPPERLISKTIVSQVMDSGLPMLTLDALEDDLASTAASILGLNVATVMCIPLTVNARPIGALYTATFKVSGRFTPETLEMIMDDVRVLGPMLSSLGQI